MTKREWATLKENLIGMFVVSAIVAFIIGAIFLWAWYEDLPENNYRVTMLSNDVGDRVYTVEHYGYQTMEAWVRDDIGWYEEARYKIRTEAELDRKNRIAKMYDYQARQYH
jgi:nitrogen fixation-related uncharacterized protein